MDERRNGRRAEEPFRISNKARNVLLLVALPPTLLLGTALIYEVITKRDSPPNLPPTSDICDQTRLAQELYRTPESLDRFIAACKPTGDKPPILIGRCIRGAMVTAEIEVRDRGRRVGAIPITDGRLPC